MDLDDLMDMKGPYYYIYDLKSEDIPSEEEWMMRMDEVTLGMHQLEPESCGEGMAGEEEGDSETPNWTEEVNVVTKTATGSTMRAMKQDVPKRVDVLKEEL